MKQVKENFRGNDRVEIFNNLMADNSVDDIKYSNYIVLAVADNDCYAPHNNKTAYPYFQTISNDNSMVFGGKNAYILISGSLRNCYSKANCYPFSYRQYEYENPIVKDSPDALFLVAKLEWNGLYWNGTAWTNEESVFNITFIKGNLSDEERALDNYLFNDIEFLDTKQWYSGVEGKGYLIPMPED
ncbi:MAG: hypothetical protein HUJ56_06935 [Erysipelotrichaceae bacterium]|nr:hypothetical protein [Erysipelotrichaceae bacterium]